MAKRKHRRRVHWRDRVDREFLCGKCGSWVLNCRDLREERIDLETGEQYRRYECLNCGNVTEFEGHRNSRDWRRADIAGRRAEKAAVRERRAADAERLFRERCEGVGIDAETARVLLRHLK